MRTALITTVTLAWILLIPVGALGQDLGTWNELKAFHTVMSQTFHPAEEGDFAPIKARSGELLEKALAWQASALPAEYQNVEDIETVLAALVEGSKRLDAKVSAGAKNEELAADLNALHNVFHKIVGLCKPGHGHH